MLTEPGEYIILLKDVPSEKEVIEIMSEIAFLEVVKEIMTKEKMAKRSDNKKPYKATKTRDPVNRLVESKYYKMSEKEVFEETLSSITRLSAILNDAFGIPIKLSWSRYNPLVILALLVVKIIFGIGFRRLADRASSWLGIDISKTWLHEIATTRLNLPWLFGLVVLLDEEIVVKFGSFFGYDKLRFIMIDGTKLRRAHYDYSGEKARRGNLNITASIRILTSSIRVVELGLPADVSWHFKAFRRGDVVLIDGYFDSEANFEAAWFRGIEVHCPINYVRRGTARRRAKQYFDRRIYRLRKIGEKSFTLVFSRLEPIIWKESNDLIYSLLASIANNVKALIKAKIRISLFYKIELPR